MKKRTIFLGIIDILIIIVLMVIYVYPSFKEWWITTSVATGNHKYFASIFYSDNSIKEVLKNNIIEEVGEDTNLDDITFDNIETDTYESIYEEQILSRDKDAVYKLIKINEKDYKGYLVAVYDAKRISLAISKNGQTLKDIVKDNKAILGINASGFNTRNSVATATVIKNSKVVSSYGYNRHGGGLIGFTKSHKLMLTTANSNTAIKNGIVDAVTFGPFLIVNGKSANVSGNGGMGLANRTAIAQRRDGIVLFLVIDGRGANGSNGISIKQMISLLSRYKAYNAANLDGGGSSTLVIRNKLINNPRGYYGDDYERRLPNAWIVK